MVALTWVVLTAKSGRRLDRHRIVPSHGGYIEAAPSTRNYWSTRKALRGAKRRVDLVAQVAGKVGVSDAFADGGFFEKDDVLLSIERDDYEFALAQAESALAPAERRLAEERGRSRRRSRMARLGSDEANDLF